MKKLIMIQKPPVFEAVQFTGGNEDEIKLFSNRKITRDQDFIRLGGAQEYIVHIGEYVIKLPDGTIYSASESHIKKEYEIIRE